MASKSMQRILLDVANDDEDCSIEAEKCCGGGPQHPQLQTRKPDTSGWEGEALVCSFGFAGLGYTRLGGFHTFRRLAQQQLQYSLILLH